MSGEVSSNWHLDKKVPITLIVTLIVQSATIVWWARGIEARVYAVEKDQAKQEKRDDNQDREARDAVIQLRAQLERIDQKLDRLIERGAGIK